MNGKQLATSALVGGLAMALFTPQVLPSTQAKEASSEWQSQTSTPSERMTIETEETMTSSVSSESSAKEQSEETKGTNQTTNVIRDSSTTSVSKESESTMSSESSVKEEQQNKPTKEPVEKIEKEAKKETKKEAKKEANTLPAIIEKEQIEDNYEFSVVKNQTTNEFIQAIGVDAQQIAWKNKLYASVMIAQAILETGSGNSQLARAPYYNLFGIKGSYQGQSVNFSTAEDDGSGSLYTIKSNFRKYPSYKESLEDYAELLKGGISGNALFYQQTWKSYATTYKEATAFLTGRYATDTSYDKKLNALIETYGLTKFDQEPNKKAADTKEKTNSSTTTSLERSSEQTELSSSEKNSQETAVEEPLFHSKRPASVDVSKSWYSWSSAKQAAEEVEGKQVVSKGGIYE